MKKCYTIGTIQDISDKFDTVQFTENSRIGLSRRNSASHVKAVRSRGVKCNIVVHQDFIYIASRYLMFSQDMRKSILAFLKTYNGVDITGIVMHTDFPIRREVVKAKDKNSAINEVYGKAIWNKEIIIDAVNNDEPIVEKSILALAQDIVNYGITSKIYLENTTSVGPNGEASIQWLISLFHKYPNLSSVFGIAYDTLHQYAVDGTWLTTAEVKEINDHICPVIVHLNTVPEEVTPGSRRDRHSLTTIYECSKNTADYYKAYAESLDKAGIVWVREVKEETMLRELELCNQK